MGVLFFLNLLGNEPVEFAAGGIVVFSFCEGIQVIDKGCNFLLMSQCVLESG